MIISILHGTKSGSIPIISGSIGITPELVSVLCRSQHTVLVEGEVNRKEMKAYLAVGAYIINTKEELLDRGDLIIKKARLEPCDIEYVHGEGKIFFSTIDMGDRAIVEKAIAHEISLINYKILPGLEAMKTKKISAAKFSNYIAPFILSLAGKGLKALVDDEVLRDALLLMRGKAYNGPLASLHHLQCYEY